GFTRDMIEGVEIRPLTELHEMEEVEALQRLVWNEAAIQSHLMIAFVRNGGNLIGAIKDGRIVGFVFGYLGVESPEARRPAMANLKLASQRMAVLPEFRDSGIGYELKLAQRNFAIAQGIRLITWTSDPVLSRNAYLNIRKLGAIVREYRRDYYGNRAAPQVTLGTSDRLILEWWITSHRVKQRVEGTRGGLGIPQYLGAGANVINLAHSGTDGFLYPNLEISPPTGEIMLVEIPDNIMEIIAQQPSLARAWRQHVREVLGWAISSGFAVTDFMRGPLEGCTRSLYALTRYYEGVSGVGFSSN
ncbi:MAG TPA: GNAT family N-acetyltransferase, partial [Aggregatilineales bacterium]|nr:GNAT family N-acetyltransferase [Aggregatilineales bacterium]